LKHGTSFDEFRNCSHKLSVKFLADQNGFISRKLLLLQDNETWADLVFWKDTATANAAEKIFMNDPITKAYGNLIDMDTIKMEHSNEVSHFDK